VIVIQHRTTIPKKPKTSVAVENFLLSDRVFSGVSGGGVGIESSLGIDGNHGPEYGNQPEALTQDCVANRRLDRYSAR